METLTTQFKADQFTLQGSLHLPDTPCPPLVVGSHGLEGSMASAKQTVLARLLPENGIAFFRFDHRGCGKSDGDFVQDTSLGMRTRDFTAAAAHALDLMTSSDQIAPAPLAPVRLAPVRLALFGSSMGGATCINAWQDLEAQGIAPAGAVLCAAPVKSRTIQNIPFEGNGNRPDLPLDFFKDNLLFNLLDKARHLHHVMVFHGDADQIVPLSNAHDLYRAVKEPKALVIHENGAHQMDNPADQADFEIRALDWYKKIFSL